jgi:hypothetical protein
MREILRVAMVSAAVSLLLNVLYVAIQYSKAQKDLEIHGIAAVAFSIWSFIGWTVVGTMVLSLAWIVLGRLLKGAG